MGMMSWDLEVFASIANSGSASVRSFRIFFMVAFWFAPWGRNKGVNVRVTPDHG